MSKVALVIIYNHQYNKNINVLESIYAKRFSKIYHLVPFYVGDKANVIPVYENSYYFQGYVAQGYTQYFKKEYSHYLFIADDLILNPCINENNYATIFKLNNTASFIPSLIVLHKRRSRWWSAAGEAFRYNIHVPGVEAENQLPDYNAAMQAFKKFELEIMPLSFNQIWDPPVSFRDFLRMIVRDDRFYLFRYIISRISNKKYNLPYPLVGSYSDIFVISSDTIKQFCNYCGIFAATKLFVEIALPTSLVLSATEIRTENDLNLKGRQLWTKEDYKILDKYKNNLNQLLAEFPENYLYLHAIKLSKWSMLS